MIKNKNLLLLMLMMVSLVLGSCVKDEFDEPPSGGEDPAISQDQITSLEEVFDKQILGDYVKLDIDKYIQAVVVADDESGNFFRTIIIEDENSDRGIALLIDEVELYNTYPVGRRVFVNLSDLWIGDYNGLPQMGAAPYDDDGDLRLAGIQSELAKAEVVIPGVYNLPVEPTITEMNLLGNMALNTLIKIENVQFKQSSAGVTYSIADPPTGVNHSLVDCNGNEIIVRSSGFADFANEITPEGNGSITAVYGVFGSDRQLLIRDTDDVNFDQPRCETPTIPISTIRSNYDQGASSAPSGLISGVVISDYTSGNVTGRNLFIQDESAGILVRFTGNHSFAIGSELVIDVTGQELSEFRDLLQINNVPNANVEVVGLDALPDPQEVTVSQIIDDFESYESEYIKIKDATISGGSTYSGGLDVSDATGTIDMFTQSGATFANDAVPSGNVEITAIVSIFNSPQIILNSSNDVKGGGSTGGGDQVDISTLRAEFNNGAMSAPEGFIEGVVISDRSTSNINGRNAFIQDGTGGIVVRFNDDHTLNSGDLVQVNVSAQELSEFRGLLQVNNVSNGAVVVTGSSSLPQPTSVTVNDLLSDIDQYESTLVMLSDVALGGSGTFSGSINVTDATGTISMFTGSGATFADQALPDGTVDMIVIASQFDDPQVILRNTGDIDGGGSTGGGGDLTIMSLRAAFEGGATTASNGKIEGVVISDNATENTTVRNLHIQDASGGITIRFTETHSFALGTLLEIDVSGQELSEFRGLLQVNNVPLNVATDKGMGTLPDPKVLTVAQVIADSENLESTLVRVNDVMITGGSTWNGGLNVVDDSGTIIHFTRGDASFSGDAVPTGKVDIIAMVTQFDDPQLTIRNLNDIIN
ncbi:MAG: hypothetical protein HKN68_05400 [Saprospiraceae bacterium]|nr:hypothetical protein [Saprospiraceae bacterium]